MEGGSSEFKPSNAPSDRPAACCRSTTDGIATVAALLPPPGERHRRELASLVTVKDLRPRDRQRLVRRPTGPLQHRALSPTVHRAAQPVHHHHPVPPRHRRPLPTSHGCRVQHAAKSGAVSARLGSPQAATEPRLQQHSALFAGIHKSLQVNAKCQGRDDRI